MEKNPLEPFRTDDEWKERLEWFRTDMPPIRKQLVVSKKKPQPLVLLASGMLSVMLGVGVIASPAFAGSNEPLLNVLVGKEPHKPLVQPRVVVEPEKQIEPYILLNVGEPKKPEEKPERKQKLELEPNLEQERKPEKHPSPKPIATPQPVVRPAPELVLIPRTESPEVVKKSPKVTHPSDHRTGEERVSPEPQPSLEAVSRPVASIPSNPSVPSSDLKQQQEPILLASTSFSQSSQSHQSNQLKDATPIRKTENGGKLPKTAGNSAHFVLGGGLLLFGGYQLRRVWRMRDV